MTLTRLKNHKAAKAEFEQAHRLDPNMPQSPDVNER
jgi:hypothetical protein